ncbi:MAG: GNAT family N-acetyltransferase [Clostridia bacterium]|nr:GNAT family N-acetyltransferase [Clostridia bacterium]
MNVIRINENNAAKVIPLIASFRAELLSYKGTAAEPDAKRAEEELFEFLDKGYPVFAAEQDDGKLMGHIVCRIEDECIWVEQLFVSGRYRRQGVASLLFGKAEEIAGSMGEETVFNFVHPNNDGMIAFLRSKGYTVLNLIEIRKPYAGERLRTKVRVDENAFDY